MKKNMLRIAAVALIFSGLAAFKVYDGVLQIGATLPKAELKLKDIQDREVSMKDAKQKNGLLVMFSCNTCPYVIKNQQRTKMIAQYALKSNIGVILLNSNEGQRADADSYEAMRAYAKDQDYSWYYAVDPQNTIADALGANRTPECYLFDKDLKLTYHGAIDDNPSDPDNVNRLHLKEAINEMVAGKEVSTKETRSVGCSIKRKA